MKIASDVDQLPDTPLKDFIPEPSTEKDEYLIIKQHEIQEDGVGRRRFRRFNIRLMGRFMLENKSEYTCRIMNISAGGSAIASNVQPPIGETVILYMDHIGRAKGHIARSEPNHFAIAFDITDTQKERMELKISWLINQIDGGKQEMRRHHRFHGNNKENMLTLPGEIEIDCKVENFSLSGASVITNARPDLGAEVALGQMKATVVRHHDNGIGIEFTDAPSAAKLLAEFGLFDN